MSNQVKQGWEPSFETVKVFDDALWNNRHRDDGQKLALIAAVAADPLLSAAKDMQDALEEALAALNGAPNTEGLHCQIQAALSKSRGE